MLKIVKQNKESVIRQIHQGKIDAITLSKTHIVDDIILNMHENRVLDCIKNGFEDKRADNTTVPNDIVWILGAAAKMKVHTSLTDIPHAISDHRVLEKLKYTMVDTDGSLGKGLMREGTIRALLGKYKVNDFINSYNKTVQNYILPLMDIQPNIFILDCTEVTVNLNNSNYEGSTVARDKKDDKKYNRGYKLATLRGITGDTGIIVEIRFSGIHIHDVDLGKELLMNTKILKPGDILIVDRGFISRDLMNFLKTERGVDTYIPLKSNMHSFIDAVAIAKKANDWKPHPNRNRHGQRISFVPSIGNLWGDEEHWGVDVNACVVWDKHTDDYHVFTTTDITQSAKHIILTYELRPEIEEDYRQLKDFWKLEYFRSRKLIVTCYHIVSTLLGYLFFQLYTLLPEGEEFAHKCLPVIQKNYVSKVNEYLIFYTGDMYATFSIWEFGELYSSLDSEVKLLIRKLTNKVNEN